MSESFKYPLPPEAIPPTSSYSQEVVAALSQNAPGFRGAELLIDKTESQEIKDLKDIIESQLTTSLTATNKIIDQLKFAGRNIENPSLEDIQTTLDNKMDEWQANGALKWCAEYIKANGGTVSLIATPNILVTCEELASMVQAFGWGQNISAYIDEDLLSRYSPEELSGQTESDAVIRLNLIPSSLDMNHNGTVEEQKELFKQLEADNPGIRVPSVLDALTYWHTLRAGGDELSDNSTLERTFIRHIDLPDKKFSVTSLTSLIPYSCILDTGKPDLDFSPIKQENDVRFMIG